MQRLRTILCAAALLLAALSAPAVQAGDACEDVALSPDAVAAAADNALRVAAALDAADAPVAIVSRVGTDLSKHGLFYSHAGFALRDHPDGRWTVVHLLNDCGSDRSALHAQGLVNFYADDLVRPDTRITWLRRDLADALAAHLLALQQRSTPRLHTPRYSVIARPGSREYQNSTAWILETLALAEGRARGIAVRDRASAWSLAELQGFTPDTVHIAYRKRIVGGLFAANVAFTDHQIGTRLSGDYPVVTVRAILRWLARNGAIAQEREWREGRESTAPEASMASIDPNAHMQWWAEKESNLPSSDST